MAQPYQLVTDFDGVLRVADAAYIPSNEANRDWQEYQAWLDAGNTPDPADPPYVPEPAPIELPAHPVNDMDATTKLYVDEAIAAALGGRHASD